MEAVIVAVVSGFISVGAGLWLDTKREKARIEENRALLRTGICCDLARAIHHYDEVIADWERVRHVWRPAIEALKRADTTYANNRAWLGLFDEEGHAEEISRYHADAADVLRRIEQCMTHAGADMPAQAEPTEITLEQALRQLPQLRQRALQLLTALDAGDDAVAA